MTSWQNDNWQNDNWQNDNWQNDNWQNDKLTICHVDERQVDKSTKWQVDKMAIRQSGN